MFTNCVPLPDSIYAAYDKYSFRLKQNESWRGITFPHVGLSKEEKEGLNAFIFCILTPIFEREKGIVCNMHIFPLYFFKRICSKSFLWDAKPANKKYLEDNEPDFEARKDKYIYENLVKDLNKDFVDWMLEACSKLDDDTIKCFNVAKAIATFIEFNEIKDEMRPDQIQETRWNIYNELAMYSQEFPFINDIIQGTGEYYGNLLELFKNISWSRYTFRWQGYFSPVKCSILTHMLDSAVLGYLMFIENNLDKLKTSTPSSNPKLFDALEKSFSVMLFHDIAEIWTDDIPSPAKDGMEIRKTTEAQELEALNKYFYSKTPDFVDKYFQNGIMLEDIEDPELKSFFKSADYFSADMEVWWNICCGSTDIRFLNILRKSYYKERRTPIAEKTLGKYLEIASGFRFVPEFIFK